MPPTKLTDEMKDIIFNADIGEWEKIKDQLGGYQKFNANGLRKRKGLPAFETQIQEKHSYNEDFFLTGGLKASYWAGFIAADGNIYRRYGHSAATVIGLSRLDEDHLRTFLSDIGGGRLYYGKHRTKGVQCENVRVSITSNQIAEDLEKKFNIVERKSLVLKPPGGLNRKETLAFIAGYIDGDGCYTYRSYKDKKYPRVTVLGTEQMLNWIKTELGFPDINIHKRSNIFAITFSGGKALDARNQLYELSGEIPFLPRKYKKWESIGIDTRLAHIHKR